MSWAEKELKKYKLRKQIDWAMESPEYKKRQQKHDMNVFFVYCLISADYLSREEKYKEEQMKKFLDHVKEQMKYVADDDEYNFKLLNEAIEDETGVNVMEYMGFIEE